MELVLDNLACTRAGRRVLGGFSARVAAGQAAELTGPNGAGKSTLLRVLAGLIPPDGGDAALGTLSLRRDGFAEQVLLAGHLDAVKPALTVRANLAHWAAVYGSGGAVDGALERFGLGAIAGQPAAQCSAGQKRRLGLARLLVIDRPLWLLDEPTVSLDAASATLVAGLIRAHLARGGLCVVATHIPLGLDAVRWDMAPAASGQARPASETAPETDPFLAGRWA